MSWQDLLQTTPEHLVMPWIGGRRVFWGNREFVIEGRLPRHHGWYTFSVSGGKSVFLIDQCDFPNHDLETAKSHKVVIGHLVGDRLIPLDVSANTPNEYIFKKSLRVFLVDGEIQPFSKVTVVRTRSLLHIFLRQEMAEEIEEQVHAAFLDRKDTVLNIKGVSPSLDLAFRFSCYVRSSQEERERKAREEREKIEALERLRESVWSAENRRVLATSDFRTSAAHALRVGGAELIDVRASGNGQWTVWYSVIGRRLECVVDSRMRVTDAGVCLTDEETHEKGDSYFTLESLPSVIREADKLGVLVVWRHAPGDRR